MRDAFSACHPAVNFLYFAGAMGCGVVFQHPAWLAVSLSCGLAYYLFLGGRRAWKALAWMLPTVLFLAAVNPLLNTEGAHTLFWVGDRPYTLEALAYGGALAGVLLTMLLWFGCYNHVLTGDKFTALFGNWIPSLSLLLVMVLRLVPQFLRKAAQISGARKAIGKEGDGKLQEGMTVLGSLLSWALEGSLVTADSMRARGYGTAKRQSFCIFTMEKRDKGLLCLLSLLLGAVILGACLGQANATYTPNISVAPPSWGVILYGVYLFIPLAMNIKEAIAWHIFRSGI